MANLTWIGNAEEVAQVETFTVGSSTTGQTFGVTINGKTVFYTAISTDSIASIATNLQAALTGQNVPQEFTDAIWTTDNISVVTATAATPGVPFTDAVYGTGTLTKVTVTASSGPNYWDVAANWSTGNIPATGDHVYFENSSVSCLYDLNQSSLVLAGLVINASYTGQLGLPEWNSEGYYEYRGTYLQIQTPILNVGLGTGGGSSVLKVNLGSATATAINVESTGTASSTTTYALSLQGTNSGNTLSMTEGSVGCAPLDGQSMVLATVNVGYTTNQQTDCTLFLGTGCTLTTVNQLGGTITANTAITTLTQNAGSLTFLGAGAMTTLNGYGGTVYYQSTGILGSATLGDSQVLNCTQNLSSRTITNVTMLSGSSLIDSFKTVTFTNPIYIQGCSLDEVTLDLGVNFHLARS